MAAPVVYENFRPPLPGIMYLEIMSFIEQGFIGRGLPKPPTPYPSAVDVGCSQSKFISGLGKHFKEVTGIETSHSQLNQVPYLDKSQDNISYKVGSFDSIPLPDGSCDFVSSFMTAPFMESKEKFHAEADRLLKPGGSLLVGGYSKPFVHYGNGRMDDELREIQLEFLDDPLIKKYKTDGDKELENLYDDWILPYEEFLRNDDLNISQSMTLTEYMNCIRSEHFCKKFMEHREGEEDPIATYEKYLHEATDPKSSPDDINLHIMWRIFFIVARKPV